MALLRWAAAFLVLAIIAALLGFTGAASGFADIAKALFFVFLVGVVILVTLGLIAWRKIT